MIALIVSGVLSVYLILTAGIFTAKTLNIPAGYTEKILIGLALVNTITSMLSLFIPIDIWVLCALLVCSTLILFFIKIEIKQLFECLKTRKKIILCTVPFIIVALIISIGPPHIGDTGLYHLQTIKWIEEYSVVPGLANLHGRFGFNSNIHTFFALTSLSEIFHQEIFSVNVTLFAVFMVYYANRLYTVYTQEGISNVFLFYAIIVCSILNLSVYLSSPTPDYISITLPLFVLSSLYKRPDRKEKIAFENYYPILILCTYAVTVKLAALPIQIVAAAIVFNYKSDFRKIVRVLLFLCIIAAPWIARTIVLTGWIVYPFPSVDVFSFDWKVPLSAVVAEKLSITGWARSPGLNFLASARMNNFEWVPFWWSQLFIPYKILIAASVVFPIASLIGYFNKKIELHYQTVIIVCTSLLGVVYWFLLAPDIRFGAAFILVAAVSPLLTMNKNIPVLHKPFFNSAALCIVLSTIILGIYAKQYIGFNQQRSVYENYDVLIVPKIIEVPDGVGFKTYTIRNTTIYVPTGSDRCFNHALPCTPYYDSTLMLRGSSLGAGFKRSADDAGL